MTRCPEQLAILWEMVPESGVLEVRLGSKTLKVNRLHNLSLEEQK